MPFLEQDGHLLSQRDVQYSDEMTFKRLSKLIVVME